jgi:hypothetical protein
MPGRISDSLSLGIAGKRYIVPSIASASAAISVICSISALEIECYRHTPVQDVIAPPKPKSYILYAPRLISAKRSRCRKKSGGNDNDDDHYETGSDGGGGDFNSGDGSGDDNSGGGSDWSHGWNDDERRNHGLLNGETVSLLYQILCLVSLSQCLNHAYSSIKSKKPVISTKANAFMDCSSSCNHGLDLLYPMPVSNHA